MTITEKILCSHTDLKEVHSGMLINAKVDIALGNDITAPIAIVEFKKAGGVRVFDRDKVVLVPDHFTPNKDIDSAQQCKFIRKFAQEQEITHYYEVGGPWPGAGRFRRHPSGKSRLKPALMWHGLMRSRRRQNMTSLPFSLQ